MSDHRHYVTICPAIDQIYGVSLAVCVDPTAIERFFTERGVEAKHSIDDVRGYGLTYREKKYIIMYINPEKHSSTECINTVAHEVSHALDFIDSAIGEEDVQFGETRAYRAGYVMEEAYYSIINLLLEKHGLIVPEVDDAKDVN